MPDWSYRTILRPLLFRLPPTAARDLSLGVMGTLARLPMGPALIDFLGHMRADARLRRSYLGLTFPTAIGLGGGLDVEARALPALARFGFGFLEVGPVTLRPLSATGALERRPELEAIRSPDPPDNPGLVAMARRLSQTPRLGIPLLVRLAVAPGATPEQATDDCRQMVEALAPHVDGFSLLTATPAVGFTWNEGQRKEHLRAVLQAVRGASPPRALLLGVPPDLDFEQAERLVGAARELGVDGVLVDGGLRTSSDRLMGSPGREPALRMVRHLRQRWRDDLVIVSSGGVHEPEDALQLFEAGANLVQIDSGLVYTGTGLPKRVNEALLFASTETGDTAPESESLPPAELTWFWTLLLGIGMLIGSLLALVIAATRVVLPYDEAFLGLTRAHISAANDRLLAFMTHDRVSLAGTMIAIGVLYCGLSYFGIRRGLHWARVTVLSSAFVGFGSFFLFLGFGYFDPFHAFVTATLFPMLLLGLHSRLRVPPERPAFPNLRNDWRWRWSLWGQLLFLFQASGFLGAGLVIAGIGVTTVFVPEDLEFLRTTAEALAAVSPRLLPLVAHDRASLGGMLVVAGMAFLMPTLWGFRQGARWLWWTLLAAGIPGYAAAIGVHFAVGYTNLWHLTPAFAGVAVFAAGLGLSYPYLCQADPGHEEAWKRHLDRWKSMGHLNNL